MQMFAAKEMEETMRKILLTSALLVGACGGVDLVAIDEVTEDGQTLNAAAVDVVLRSADKIGLGRSDSLRQRQRFVDELGQEHTRFERSFRGLPVRGGDMVVHRGAAVAEDVTVSSVAPLALGTNPTVTAPEAATLAGAGMGFAVRPATGPSNLVIYAYDGLDKAALSYEVVTEGTQSDGTPSVLHSFIDAHSGHLLGAYDEIETVSGTGKGIHNGTVTIETTLSGGKYVLQDGARGNGVTVDLNNGTGTGANITATANSFGDGTTKSRQSAAVDAHYGAAMTWDYYKNTHGRNGIAGDGKAAQTRVHYGTAYNNAFWSDGCFCMTYGDGDGTQLRPLVALDVAGHEMSHGVTSVTAKLVYLGESGGLNEATSDIFGTAVEFAAKNTADPGDYLIGEKIMIGGKGFLRSMISPTDDGRSVDHYSKYKNGLDVHLSSGIANNFFYLLSEGGTNKTSKKAVTGIGRAKAEKIWYRALTTYMTSSTNFKAARAATLKAVKDLYGAGKAEETAVAAAWTAVGVS